MVKKLRRTSRAVSRAVLSLAEGVFSFTVDLGLWLTIYFAEASVPFKQSGNLWRAQIEADRFLEKVNYNAIKNALTTANRHGWIKKNYRHAMPEITSSGKSRLVKAIPTYDELRNWDGKIHMVTYDIPEQRANDRHLLREYLKRIGCGRLQDSVWITPYNPIDIVRLFLDKKGLGGTVIVSDMGKDGAIGEEDLQSLTVRVYKLDILNERYKKWLNDYNEKIVDHWAAIQFLSILKDDPQLPFALLPTWWKGREVYALVKPLLRKVTT